MDCVSFVISKNKYDKYAVNAGIIGYFRWNKTRLEEILRNIFHLGISYLQYVH